MKPGDLVDDNCLLCRHWPNLTPKVPPPDESWLQAAHYGDQGWSFDIIQYDQQLDDLKKSHPTAILVTIKAKDLKHNIDGYNFYVVYTPTGVNIHHCDLVCDDLNGQRIITKGVAEKILRKYRKYLLDPIRSNTFIFKP